MVDVKALSGSSPYSWLIAETFWLQLKGDQNVIIGHKGYIICYIIII